MKCYIIENCCPPQQYWQSEGQGDLQVVSPRREGLYYFLKELINNVYELVIVSILRQIRVTVSGGADCASVVFMCKIDRN